MEHEIRLRYVEPERAVAVDFRRFDGVRLPCATTAISSSSQQNAYLHLYIKVLNNAVIESGKIFFYSGLTS